jgi:signal peptidase I
MPRRIREYLPVALVVIGLLAARSSLADHYVIPSGSMERTLFAGDRVLVDKRAYGLRVPFTAVELLPGERARRGDVVVFDSPADGVRLIKRVVGIPGDVLEVRDGRVWVDGATPARGPTGDRERYPGGIAELGLIAGGGPDLPPTRIPPGHVFVLGDARGNSRDSRWFGLVREDALDARALGVYYRAGEGLVWKPL